MQYILSEEEYQALQDKGKQREIKNKEQLFELCQQAAHYVPVKRYWDKKNTKPWGCIYTKCPSCGAGAYEGMLDCECDLELVLGSEEAEDAFLEKVAPYCDECPSQKICPRDKSYSK